MNDNSACWWMTIIKKHASNSTQSSSIIWCLCQFQRILHQMASWYLITTDNSLCIKCHSRLLAIRNFKESYRPVIFSCDDGWPCWSRFLHLWYVGLRPASLTAYAAHKINMTVPVTYENRITRPTVICIDTVTSRLIYDRMQCLFKPVNPCSSFSHSSLFFALLNALTFLSYNSNYIMWRILV